ncbi:MAG: hemolysin family protein [Acidimicrobiales bacterium]
MAAAVHGQDGRRHRRNGATEQERMIIERLAVLRDMEVREVMTPRVDVVSLQMPVKAESVITAARESGHSCFPVVGDDLDDLVGVLFVNDLLRATPRGAGSPLADRSPIEISRRVRQPHVVPESRQVLEVLSEMRAQQRGFAVVVDEYGGVAGVLTVKDLLEPLVGEMHDELDAGEDPEIVRVDTKRWLLDGQTSVDDVRARLGIELAEGKYVTVGGYLFDRLGHIPEEGERLAVDGWELRVVEMDRRRIAQVLAVAPMATPPRVRSDTHHSGGTVESPSHDRPTDPAERLG